MTPERLKEVLRKHSMYLNDPTTGERAYLKGAYLKGAYLKGAYLKGANLKYAYLKGAKLQGAKLQDANLQGAYLKGANLKGANLKGAYLQGADLQDANLEDAYLQDANLRGADLQDANLKGAKLPSAPVVPNLDLEIYNAIQAGGTLDMYSWHTCETTHCRAGWAIALAGEEGKRLEREVGPALAGTLIYHASTGRVPNFYATSKVALKDIEKCANA